MSARKHKISISRSASRDLAEIRTYSLQNWGEQDALDYVNALRRGIDSLQDHPERGISREDLGPRTRGLTIGRHRIFYRLSSSTIRVLRVVHVRRDEKRLDLN